MIFAPVFPATLSKPRSTSCRIGSWSTPLTKARSTLMYSGEISSNASRPAYPDPVSSSANAKPSLRRDRKVAHIESTAPDVIATGNIGCMVQIAGGTRVPVVHTIALLDWATGGPAPTDAHGRTVEL